MVSINRTFTDLCVIMPFRVIDVGSEWRSFSSEKSNTDRSRVGAAEVHVMISS